MRNENELYCLPIGRNDSDSKARDESGVYPASRHEKSSRDAGQVARPSLEIKITDTNGASHNRQIASHNRQKYSHNRQVTNLVAFS